MGRRLVACQVGCKVVRGSMGKRLAIGWRRDRLKGRGGGLVGEEVGYREVVVVGKYGGKEIGFKVGRWLDAGC